MRAAGLLFAMLALGSPVLALASPPDLIRIPSVTDFRKVYPRHAYERDVEGSGTIQCVFNGQGKLDACRLLSEDPQGVGFGKAALALAQYYQAKPVQSDGKPIEGAPFTTKIEFTLDLAPL